MHNLHKIDNVWKIYATNAKLCVLHKIAGSDKPHLSRSNRLPIDLVVRVWTKAGLDAMVDWARAVLVQITLVAARGAAVRQHFRVDPTPGLTLPVTSHTLRRIVRKIRVIDRWSRGPDLSTAFLPLLHDSNRNSPFFTLAT